MCIYLCIYFSIYIFLLSFTGVFSALLLLASHPPRVTSRLTCGWVHELGLVVAAGNSQTLGDSGGREAVDLRRE